MKDFSKKNFFKFLGIIVFAAVIVFSMAGCKAEEAEEEEEETTTTTTTTSNKTKTVDVKLVIKNTASNGTVVKHITLTTGPLEKTQKTFFDVGVDISKNGQEEQTATGVIVTLSYGSYYVDFGGTLTYDDKGVEKTYNIEVGKSFEEKTVDFTSNLEWTGYQLR